MMIVNDLAAIAGSLQRSCITIGNFDGVHKGHQQLFQHIRKKALACGATSVAITFDPHPAKVVSGGKALPLITLTEQKLELIAGEGIDICLVLPFNKNFAALSAREFVSSCLVEDLQMKHLVIGYDYAFGKGREGDYDTLKELGRDMGFEVDQLPAYAIEGQVVSSSFIRDMIMAGRVFEARKFLGRFYTVKGRVLHGAKRGGDLLGFPTANMCLVDELRPALGVYAVWVKHGDSFFSGVSNIGYNPTFGENALSVEVHILDFSGDIYGQILQVQFVKRLRLEKKFFSVGELQAQIIEDVRHGREVLAGLEPY